MTIEIDHYGVALSDVCSPFAAFRPPRRVSVSQGAADILRIKQPGGYVGAWDAAETPYMVEPMDMLASRRHDTVAFVGPARTGKTMGLLDGWMSHAVVNDPGDMLIVQMTQDKAREYSRARVDRAINNSPDLSAMKSRSSQDDNTHDKWFKHGMLVKIGWPTVSNLSSSDYRYSALTDYDRMPDDIGGEGAAYDLALKRNQTFLSRGMCMVESSPGRPITDPNWRPATAHEAPPVGGILGIYNRSDRRRWYWKCFDCRDWFEARPGLGLFNLPDEKELLEVVRETDIEAFAKQYARVICPHCGSVIDAKHKNELNMRSLGLGWITDGQQRTSDDELVGVPMTAKIAGYWLGGVAATYQSWQSLVSRHLNGLRDYALTGEERALQTTTNTDQGMPYTSRHLLEAALNASSPEERKEKDLERYIVPDWTRFIVASVDVQGGSNARFVVQVHAIGPFLEQALVNRLNITLSNREGMGDEKAPIDPAAYAEDWDLITEKVVRSTYRTSEEGRELRVKLTVVDSGGEDGVTDKAYAWYRRLRKAKEHQGVMLIKGASTKTAPMIRETWVGARSKTDTADIPLYMLNPNLLKDAVSTGLKRPVAGPGYFHFPEWLPKAFFDELQAEVRSPSGTWQQIRKRNEAFDLCAYIRAGCLRLGADKIKDWDKAPPWALPVLAGDIDSSGLNSGIVFSEDRRQERDDRAKKGQLPAYSVAQKPRPRRVAKSAYLG